MNAFTEWDTTEFSRATGDFIRRYLRDCLCIQVGDNEMAVSVECEEVGIDPSSGCLQVELKLSADVYIPAVMRSIALNV